MHGENPLSMRLFAYVELAIVTIHGAVTFFPAAEKYCSHLTFAVLVRRGSQT